MTIHFSVNIKKHLKLGGGQILDGMRALKENGESQDDVVAQYEVNGDIARLTLATEGHPPYLTLEYNAKTYMYVGFVNHWYAGRLDGYLLGLPIADFAELLLKATEYRGVWKYTSTDFGIYADISNTDDFIQYVFAGSLDVWRGTFLRHRETIVTSIWFQLSCTMLGTSFEEWAVSGRIYGGVVANFLPIIEEEQPGFTEALKWHYGIRLAQRKKEVQETIKNRIQNVSLVLGDDTLGKVFAVEGWMESQLSTIRHEARAVDYDVVYPADITPTFKGLLDGTLAKHKSDKVSTETNNAT